MLTQHLKILRYLALRWHDIFTCVYKLIFHYRHTLIYTYMCDVHLYVCMYVYTHTCEIYKMFSWITEWGNKLLYYLCLLPFSSPFQAHLSITHLVTNIAENTSTTKRLYTTLKEHAILGGKEGNKKDCVAKRWRKSILGVSSEQGAII